MKLIKVVGAGIALAIAFVAVGVAAVCPRRCQCLWRDAKITVDCASANLASVPDNVEPQTQVLNLSRNDIPALSSRQFARFGLTNLQRIVVRGCSLTRIDGHALYGLDNLVELDMADNLLDSVPSSTLNSDVPSLMSLNMRSNHIEVIESSAFHKLSFLQKLDLSKNWISVVQRDAFAGLNSLQRLYLHANRLATIDAINLPKSLHGITIHDNRYVYLFNRGVTRVMKIKYASL